MSILPIVDEKLVLGDIKVLLSMVVTTTLSILETVCKSV